MKRYSESRYSAEKIYRRGSNIHPANYRSYRGGTRL
ncbi:hypothetical protein [Flyfo microvirus Tbat2_158]|nr:hypothetical protein [Flyfo microvirus Tbat2_158]